MYSDTSEHWPTPSEHMTPDKPVATLLIIITTGIISFLAFNDRRLRDWLIFWPEAILARKEYYRIITSAFLHADWSHLLFNMFSLYFFGPTMEAAMGVPDFLLIYFASIVGGNLLSLYLHRNQDYFALGASGGVCGVIFASIFLFPGIEIGFFLLPVGIPGWLYAFLFLASEFYGLRTQRGNIGHDAHLGGAIIGLLTTTALFPQIIKTDLWLYAAVMLSSLALFVYFWKNPTGLPLKVLWKTGMAHRQERKETSATSREVDAVLDKVSREGIHSLSKQEREILERAAGK